MNSEEMLEEERRLCYVGMTRARKRLILTWAKWRRRFGGGEQERTVKSWFLDEIPAELMVNLGPEERAGEIDLTVERNEARQSARRNVYTGKTYNSVDSISRFFADRGRPFAAPGPGPIPRPPAPASPVTRPPLAPQQAPIPPKPPQPAVRKVIRPGVVVEHPKYGSGTVVRREGEGDNAKITVNFSRFGLKKLVEKYAGLKRD
jgi:DNA helicase-2/ATP-dependent DNA helicase PcrA